MEKYIASVSFGKDSLAMLLLLIEKSYPLDEVVFYDTGMEFQAIYNIRDMILPILNHHGIKYTELKPKEPFLYKMFEKPVNGLNGLHYGYSWCGGRCRWGTSDKINIIRSYCQDSYQYIGIAFDELNRLEKAVSPLKLFPLIEWKMTESECLRYCRNKGFFWKENNDIDLYDILDRVSCWCCCNKNLKELENIYNHLPDYWEKLKQLQSKTNRPMKQNNTVYDLEKRFKQKKDDRKKDLINA